MALPKIQHPIFLSEVPSTNQKIQFRPFTTKEEKILLIAKQSNDEADILNAIKQVVTNCVVSPGFDVDTITIFDLEKIFIDVRIKSVSDMVSVSYIDHEDKQTYKIDINLNNVKMIWPIEKPPVISIAENMSMTMKWPSASLYSDHTLLSYEGPDSLDRLIAKCINKIYFGDQTYDPNVYTTDELVEFLQDFESKVFEELRAFFDNMPKLLYVIEYTNTKGTSRRIELSALTDFFQFQ